MQFFTILLVLFGYILGYYIRVSLAWFLVILTIVQYISSKFLNYTTFDIRQRRRSERKRSSSVKHKSLLNLDLLVTQNNTKKYGEKIETGGVGCLNAIIEQMWQKWDPDHMKQTLNEFLSVAKPLAGLMEKVTITSVEIGNDLPPKITKLTYQQTDSKTIIEADFEYEGDGVLEWKMRPRVVPLDMRCRLHEILVYGRLRICLAYSSDGGIEELNISLSEYPDMSASVQMFEALDFNSIASSIPALSSVIKRRFKETVMMFVYPNTIPLIQKKGSGKNLPLSLGPVGKMDELEDEIKRSLLDINTLLGKKLSGGRDKDTAKKEVFESVIQFLKYGTQPGRIPVSMIETVQKGFQILYTLAFDSNKGNVCLPVFDVLMKKENISFIGHVARMCSFADDLIKGIMSIKDDKLRQRVNQVFGELGLQDVPLTVLNRRSE